MNGAESALDKYGNFRKAKLYALQIKARLPNPYFT